MGRSGALNRRVKLFKKEGVRGPAGGIEVDWVFKKNLRSYTMVKSGKQTTANDEVFDLIRIRVKVRNQHDIKEQDRIEYQGKMYDISFLQPTDIYERWLMMHCTRVNE